MNSKTVSFFPRFRHSPKKTKLFTLSVGLSHSLLLLPAHNRRLDVLHDRIAADARLIEQRVECLANAGERHAHLQTPEVVVAGVQATLRVHGQNGELMIGPRALRRDRLRFQIEHARRGVVARHH